MLDECHRSCGEQNGDKPNDRHNLIRTQQHAQQRQHKGGKKGDEQTQAEPMVLMEHLQFRNRVCTRSADGDHQQQRGHA